jgi:hypothetical protein
MGDVVYDLEVYPNVFTMTVYDLDTKQYQVFEISPRRKDRLKIRDYLETLRRNESNMIGFNNWFYDYPVLHFVYHNLKAGDSWKVMTKMIYDKSMQIIESGFDERWMNTIQTKEQIVNQIDLYRVHHFDNKARMTSLKVLEFNMRSEYVQELPFPPGTVLTNNQIDDLIDYNKHDVLNTVRFYQKSQPQLMFREALSLRYDRDFMNHNDTKIGKDYFIMRLQDEGVSCFDQGRNPIQTKRDKIVVKDIIFDYIEFQRPEFQAILNWFKARVLTSTKAVLTEIPKEEIGQELLPYCDLSGPKGRVKNLNCVIDGFRFDFGTGGIHGSVESTTVVENDEYMILDIDVTSLYPSIAIENNVYPAHLGEKFVQIYADMKKERVSYAKGSPENGMLKLALNGVYGDSNNQYSPFYDPQYTMTITINGQLMLCMLAEMVMEIPGLNIIQINTDGITMHLPRDEMPWLKDIMLHWESITGLELEQVQYSRMCIRDVNNYLAVGIDGKVKRKGAYEYDVGWHQNHSSLVIPKAAEAALVHGRDIEDFILNHDDDYDFFLRTKVPRNSRLLLEDDLGIDSEQIQNVSRYYVAREGGKLIKVMPPLKGKDRARRIGINKTEYVVVCNESNNLDRDNVDYSWYINETRKMVDPLR